VDPHVVKGAELVKHWWGPADPAKGEQTFEAEELMQVKAGGVESDSANLTTVRVNTVVEKLQFDVKEFEVTAGKRIKLILANPDFMPHNLAIVNPGTADSVATAAIALGADGFKKNFIPEDSNVLVATKLIDNKQEDVIEFTAPEKPGSYPFI